MLRFPGGTPNTQHLQRAETDFHPGLCTGFDLIEFWLRFWESQTGKDLESKASRQHGSAIQQNVAIKSVSTKQTRHI